MLAPFTVLKCEGSDARALQSGMQFTAITQTISGFAHLHVLCQFCSMVIGEVEINERKNICMP